MAVVPPHLGVEGGSEWAVALGVDVVGVRRRARLAEEGAAGLSGAAPLDVVVVHRLADLGARRTPLAGVGDDADGVGGGGLEHPEYDPATNP